MPDKKSPPVRLRLLALTYDPVGATRAADLVERPPRGFRAFSERSRIGHGDARWEYAISEVVRWGVQRNSGMKVSAVEATRPAEPRTQLLSRPVAVGDSALLGIPAGPFTLTATARVVYLVDEPNRRGFAYGTLPGNPQSGEESFIVERDPDGSIWLEIRAFSRPANRFWRLVYPILLLTQKFYTKKYFRALSGPQATT